ncbi:hypothetical protein LEP1GSC195_0262 [Leptospira wolbachii serovar Codice str. CDC]|uniref:Uncharacterized protein n=1 Tax=Leptospira wolbachii serovar Codice str. CDC TaxID=1218599 RepID=R9A6H8_9LEPT|nr:hypothetical protein [Leptospira wolbachii]EOQ97803.1 hypothetical protein LEP1GSC195_0262 [Leptospira wolbachii serovar Codice str. CDC]
MEYIESLLDEYFDLSQTLGNLGGPEKAIELYDGLLGLEEEICWECSLPASTKYRGLFRMIPKDVSKEDYIKTAVQTLSREKARFFYSPNNGLFETFKAA